MEVKILFQDKSIIVCIKPAGIESENAGMPELLKSQCGAEEIFCVHRLDKGVSGVMVFAKTKSAAAKLSAAITAGTLRKEYLAVLPGKPEAEEAVLHDLLYRDAAKNKSYVVKRMRRGVKDAELEYRVLQAVGELSLVRIRLHTGRTHQIRVQFSSRALPLLGDIKYGSTVRSYGIALFACALSFPHPQSGKEMRFEALPECTFPWNEFTIINTQENKQ